MGNGRQSSAPRVPTIRSSSLEREEVPLEQDPAKEHYQPYNDDEGDNRPPTPAESHISISLGSPQPVLSINLRAVHRMH